MKRFNQWPGDERLIRNMQEIYCKNDISGEWHAYRKKRKEYLLLGIVVLIAVILISAVILFYKIPFGKNAVERPDYGNEDISYDFYAEDDDGVTESIHMDISSKAYTEKETEEMFEAYYKKLSVSLLGENDSYECVKSDLNFSAIEGYEDVTLYIYTSDPDLIEEDGTLIEEGQEEGTYESIVYIQMNCGEYQKTYEIPIVVILEVSNESLEQYLLKEEENSSEKDSVSLPERYNGRDYNYYTKISRTDIIGLICIVSVIFVYALYAQQAKIKNECKNRRMQLEADYPMFLSRLLILIRAGLSVKKAWYKIISDNMEHTAENSRYLIREMILTKYEIESGISEKDAYLRFGKRCALPCYIKIGSLLEQNLRKGTQGMLGLLESERIMAIENRKQQVKTAGEVAGSKLMMPMMVLFALVMAIVMVPAMMSFNM